MMHCKLAITASAFLILATQGFSQVHQERGTSLIRSVTDKDLQVELTNSHPAQKYDASDYSFSVRLAVRNDNYIEMTKQRMHH